MMEAAIDTLLEGGNGFGSYYKSGGPDLEALEKAEAVLEAWTKAHAGKAAGSNRRDENSDKENTPASSQPTSQSQSQSQSQFNSQHEVEIEVGDQTDILKESNAVVNARHVVEIFECVYPRWQHLVKEKGDTEGRASGLERFDEGYILTRVIYKGKTSPYSQSGSCLTRRGLGAAAFGVLKDHDREISILEELLAQTRWRRGKRGLWYDRMALILMHHKAKAARQNVLTDVDIPDGKGKKSGEEEKVLSKAMDVILRGLHDEDTHIGEAFLVHVASNVYLIHVKSPTPGSRTPSHTTRETSQST